MKVKVCQNNDTDYALTVIWLKRLGIEVSVKDADVLITDYDLKRIEDTSYCNI